MKLTGKNMKKHTPKASDPDATTYAKVANAASKHTDPDTAIQIAKTAAKQDKSTFDPMAEGYTKV